MWTSLSQHKTDAKIQETTWQQCGKNTHHKLLNTEDQPCPEKSLCQKLLKAGRLFWRSITTSSSAVTKHPAMWQGTRLVKRLDKMPLCVVMLGQVLNIPHCLDYTSVCSQQVISGYRKPTSGSRLSPLFSFFWHIVGVCIPTWLEEWFPALVQLTE